MQIFWWGCIGSISAEIIDIFQYFNQEPVTVPERYKKWNYYVVRLIVALVAGDLVTARNITQPDIAFAIGAVAPLIINNLSKGKHLN